MAETVSTSPPRATRRSLRVAVGASLAALSLVVTAAPASASHTITWGAGTSCDSVSQSAHTTVDDPVRFVACVTIGGEPLAQHEMNLLVEGPTRTVEATVITDETGVVRWSVQPTAPGDTRVTLCDADGCLYGTTVITATPATTTTAEPVPTTAAPAPSTTAAPPVVVTSSTTSASTPEATSTTETTGSTTTSTSAEDDEDGSATPIVERPARDDGDGFPWLLVLLAVLILFLLALLLRRFVFGGGGVTLAGDQPDDDPRDEPPPVIYGEEREDDPLIPLVFVPGVMATALAGIDRRNQVQQYWPPLGFDGDIRHCLEGLQTARPTEFGIDEASEHGLLPAIHSQLIRFLNGHGYSTRDRKNLYVYAYNWLLSCDENGRGLANLLATVKQAHGRPAHVIVHSLGGLVLRSAWHIHGARDVDQVAYLASPHYGSPMAYYALHPNIPYSFMDGMVGPLMNAAYGANVSASSGGSGGVAHALTRLVSGDKLFDDTLKQVALNCGGVVELLPDHLYFQHANPTFPMAVYEYEVYGPRGPDQEIEHWAERVAPSTWEEQYLTAEWLSLPATMHQRVREAMAFKRKIAGPLPPEDGSKTLVVYGIHQPTQTELSFSQPDRDPTPVSLVARPNKQGGDGTVARLSGQGKALWAGSPRVEVENSVAHFRMTEVATVHQMLREFLPFGGHPPSVGGPR